MRKRGNTLRVVSRIFTTSFASVYPLYVAKVEKKDRTKAELDQVIRWLTGFDESTIWTFQNAPYSQPRA